MPAGNYSTQFGSIFFLINQPNNAGGTQYCAEIEDGKANDESCDKSRSYYCELPGIHKLINNSSVEK